MANSPAGTRLEVLGRLTARQVAAVTALVDDATEADGVPPLSEHVMLHMRYGGDERACNLLLWDDGRSDGGGLAAYAHLDVTDPVEWPSAELVVAPQLRRAGLGRALVDEALRRTDGHLRLWAHGELPEASAMAERLGFRRSRVLWQMRRSLLAPLPRIQPAPGVTVRTFVPGTDDDRWLALNAKAFADHPEQGGWTREDLHRRMAEEWFDPAGFFLAERDGTLVAFHWTKVHGASADTPHVHPHEHPLDGPHEHPHTHTTAPMVHGHEPIGEVYVLGVDPDAQGLGLGRMLTVTGLRHLRAKGLHQVMLYVEADNAAAIRLYESLGFSHWDTDVLFHHG